MPYIMKKLPIGIQTFSQIRSEDYIYIDKTALAYNLIEQYKYVFLSRPRRFGKSLFLDTLRNVFEGNKEYFKDLAIENRWNWNIKYPVIRVNFASGKIESRKDLDDSILRVLKENQKYLNLKCEETGSISGCFAELIKKANEKYNQKAVVLIDEYDKPILDNIESPQIAKEIRDGLVNFYSVIKGSDEFLRFAFLTGVTKFTKTSIFSGLNNITDITLHPDFGDICGYTQLDLENSFKEHLKDANMEKIQKWYNGYNFLGNKMYNPYDILQFIAHNYAFKNYWFESGTPTFLIKLIKEKNYFLPQLSNLRVGEQLLNSFDIDNIELEVVLFQAGYLTIDKVDTTPFETFEYKLKIPNKEVKHSFSDYILHYLFKEKNPITKKIDLYNAFVNKNIDSIKISLISIFASIPYNNYTNNNLSIYEGFYASVIFTYLQSLGLNIIGEDVTNKGRVDLSIIMDDVIYILEFKVDGSKALQQIQEKNYHQKYLNQNKPIYLLGIEFDSKERNIAKFEWERV